MLKYIFNETFLNNLAQKISDKVTQNFVNQQEHLERLNDNIEKLRIEVKTIDQRLSLKETKDRHEYGHIAYKISEIKNDLKSN